MLTSDERLRLFLDCRDHVVAICCGEHLKPLEVAADLFTHRSNLCPICRRDLEDDMREHLRTCLTASSSPAPP